MNLSQGHPDQKQVLQTSELLAGPLVVLFVAVGLLCGGLLRSINKSTKIPYTPMLLTLGIFLGYFRQSLSLFGQATQIVEQLNPRIILLIFVPIFIFEAGIYFLKLAFNCNWHVFRKSLLNILILAGPGVLWCAILVGCVFKAVLFYSDEQLSWYQAITLGTILSATDPVAIVSLLKQLRASLRFNTLIEGESLLNNGTVMIFFTLFLDLVKGNRQTLTGSLTDLARFSIGGPLLGIIFGFTISFWLKSTLRDSILSANITFAASYLCFYVAQFTVLQVSGILSIVSFGLYMSASGKRKIHPQSQHDVENVWSFLHFSSKTLIVVLTGILVGVKMIEESTITGWDWIRMFIFWALLMLARTIMVFSFVSIMQGSGYGISKKQIVVLIYGGIRGTIGLVLSLIVGIDHQLPVRFRQLTVFYMCGMAVLTTVINGLTCGKVIDYVEMVHYPEIKRKLFKRCVNDVLLKTQFKLKEIKQDPDLSFVKWKDVVQLANVKQIGNVRQKTLTSEMQIRHDLNESFLDLKNEEVLEEIRFRFTRYLKKIFLQLYKNGQISEQAAEILTETCEVLNDRSQLPLNYFEILSSNFSMETVRYYLYFKETTLIGPFVIRMLISKLYFVYQITAVFIEACSKAEHSFKNDFPLKNQELKIVLQEVKGNKHSALNYLIQLQTNYPQVIQAVQTSRAALILLNYKKIKLQYFYEEGFVDEKEFLQLRQQIDNDVMKVHFNEFKLDQIRLNQVLTDCPLFSNLTSDQLTQIRMKSVQILFQQDKKIIAKGQSIKSVYVVVGGSVTESYQDFYFIRVIGNILNPYDFSYNEPSKSVVKAKTNSNILKIESQIIEEFLEEVPGFKQKWYRNMFIYSVRHNHALSVIRKNLTEKQMRRLVEGADVLLLKQGDEMFIEAGGYVFQGKIQSESIIYTKQNLIPKNSKGKALCSVVLLKFNSAHDIELKPQKKIEVISQDI